MTPFGILLLLFLADGFTSIQRKMDDIVKDHLKPRSRVHLSLPELNAYEQAQAVAIAPKAIHKAKLELGEGSGTASAMVDFLELNKQRKGPSNWLMDKILEGERPVKVALHVESHGGQARVNVDRVEIGGAVMQGPALDFLIQHYVTPQFPDAKVEQWFALAHRMDHFEIHPGGVTVVVGK